MIFVTVGTHPGGFDRLIRHMDKIAGLLKEKVIIQRDSINTLRRMRSNFDFADNLEPYFSRRASSSAILPPRSLNLF